MGIVAALNNLRMPWIFLVWFVTIWLLYMLSKVLVARISPAAPGTPSWLQLTIAALNVINTPIIAIMVVLLGMIFDVISKVYGLSPDAATGIIGAGIGLLTGKAADAAAHALDGLMPKPSPGSTPPAGAAPGAAPKTQ